MKKLLRHIFQELERKIELENQDRKSSDSLLIRKVVIQLLGQMSLLANDKVSAVLHLTQTADMDALLPADHFIKTELKKILTKNGLVYDDDSHLIWIPSDAKFDVLFEFKHIRVEIIDPETALLSKAIKAPQKNKQLIQEAIACGEFKTLVQRIIKNGGSLDQFVGG